MRKRSNGGFTVIELIVIIATLLVLASVLIPSIVRAKRERNMVCANNLHQIVMAFKTWELSDESPGRVSVKAGGVAELVSSGKAFIYFMAMSNELSNPEVFVCPADKDKRIAKGFGAGFNETNVSYFVGVDARDVNPSDFLAGDRNLALNRLPLKPGLFMVSTNSPLSWTKAIHHSCGYVGCADGSVQLLNQSNLTFYVRLQSESTNRLAVP